jgi:hypothetical protein
VVFACTALNQLREEVLWRGVSIRHNSLEKILSDPQTLKNYPEYILKTNIRHQFRWLGEQLYPREVDLFDDEGACVDLEVEPLAEE